MYTNELNRKTILSLSKIDNDNGELRLVTREEWRAKPATGVLADLKTPVSLVVIQHTVQSSCDSLVK